MPLYYKPGVYWHVKTQILHNQLKNFITFAWKHNILSYCGKKLTVYFTPPTKINNKKINEKEKPIVRSRFFNATAVAAQCHSHISQRTNFSEWFARWHHQYRAIASKLILSHSPGVTTNYAPIAIFRDVSVFSPQKLLGPSPHLGTAMQTTFSPLSFGKSFMKNPFSRSRERLSGIFWRTKKTKKKQTKTEKTSVKHIRYRLIGSCVN